MLDLISYFSYIYFLDFHLHDWSKECVTYLYVGYFGINTVTVMYGLHVPYSTVMYGLHIPYSTVMYGLHIPRVHKNGQLE